MIKVDGDNVAMVGSIPTLLTELTVAIEGLSQFPHVDKWMIEHAVDLAFMTDEEVKESTEKLQKALHEKRSGEKETSVVDQIVNAIRKAMEESEDNNDGK